MRICVVFLPDELDPAVESIEHDTIVSYASLVLQEGPHHRDERLQGWRVDGDKRPLMSAFPLTGDGSAAMTAAHCIQNLLRDRRGIPHHARPDRDNTPEGLLRQQGRCGRCGTVLIGIGPVRDTLLRHCPNAACQFSNHTQYCPAGWHRHPDKDPYYGRDATHSLPCTCT